MISDQLHRAFVTDGYAALIVIRLFNLIPAVLPPLNPFLNQVSQLDLVYLVQKEQGGVQ
ncbi:hypothetical protein D3C87_2104070 [compost metagenome]